MVVSLKEIVVNKDKIRDGNIDYKVGKIKVIIVSNNKEIVLLKRYNTYELISEYINDEDGEMVLKALLDKMEVKYAKEIKPFLLKKEYITDYPTIGSNALYYTYYYKIDSDVLVFNDNSLEKIPLENVREELDANKYINPKRQENINEIMEVLSYIEL